MKYVIDAMIYLGSALMVYNIYGFIRFKRKIASGESWEKGSVILHVPITLLVLFLAGYLTVGIFGKPDLVMAGILFGGSIFVFVMYRLLDAITQKIIAQKDLEAKLMATEESNRAKNEFLSGISHEMRTPINIILGNCTMMTTDPALSDENRDKVEKISSSTKYLLGMINTILDLKSFETGDFILKNEDFSLDDAVRQVGSVAEIQCEKKGLEYACRVEEGIGNRYTGDPTRIKEVLLMLLDNAVKFTEKGSVEFSVACIGKGEETDTLRFSVKDTGIGIAESFFPKLFDTFAREDSGMTTSHGGSGLSLALAKNIVELLGGKIDVESRKGVGSTFSVTIPLRRADVDPTADEEVSLAGKRVLIVEDIPENAEIVADLLELEEIESERAENGQIAVETFAGSAPDYYDAILMDLRMPVMDGLTAARTIRNLDRPDAKTVPIIALSANAFESDIKESYAAGMNAHIAKPADSELLYSVLKINIGKNKKEG